MRSALVPLAIVLTSGCATAPADPMQDAAPAIDAMHGDAALDAGVDARPPSDAWAAGDSGLDAPTNDGGTPTCDHAYAIGDACSFDVTCTETIDGACVATCFCTPGAGVLCTYAASAACLAHFCPASQPANGSTADPPPTLTSGPSTSVEFACDYGTSDCPAHCTPGGSATSPTDYAWNCTTPAGPSCPASACPSTLGTTCSWPDDVSCSFAGPDECRFDCVCGASGPVCLARHCGCPTSEPAAGTTCPPDPYRAVCDYVAPTGESIECTCGIFIDPTWACSAPSVSCPPSPPSDTCRAGIDPTSCSYTTPPYCGHCGCDATGHWVCSASSCDMCPGSPPSNHSACTAEQIGQICDYAPGSPGGAPPHCACVGPTPTWSCS